jgi:hypothetical protein
MEGRCTCDSGCVEVLVIVIVVLLVVVLVVPMLVIGSDAVLRCMHVLVFVSPSLVRAALGLALP